MRLPFNTTCDLYHGSGTSTPGVLRGTFPCRYVVEDGIFTIGAGVPNIPGYMTIDAVLPNGAFTIPQIGLDPSLADTVAIPSGTPPKFWVIYTDQIIWKWHPPYYRAYLVRLPIPPHHGGVILNSTAIYNYLYTWPPLPLGSGGVLLNSSGIRGSARNYIAKGGIVVNSAGVFYTRRDFIPLGGVKLNQGALYTTFPHLVGKGGILCNSLAEAEFVRTVIAQGGVKLNSDADWVSYGSGSGAGPPPLPSAAISEILDSVSGHTMQIATFTAFSPSVGWKVQITGSTVVPDANGLWLVTNVISSSRFDLGSGPSITDGSSFANGTITRVG